MICPPSEPSIHKQEAVAPLTPAMFHILLALADGEKHGYAILKEVEEQSNVK